jgi:hypothetical protein
MEQVRWRKRSLDLRLRELEVRNSNLSVWLSSWTSSHQAVTGLTGTAGAAATPLQALGTLAADGIIGVIDTKAKDEWEEVFESEAGIREYYKHADQELNESGYQLFGGLEPLRNLRIVRLIGTDPDLLLKLSKGHHLWFQRLDKESAEFEKYRQFRRQMEGMNLRHKPREGGVKSPREER